MYLGLYAASKRSLELFSETLRLELQPFGVHVSSIVTGAVRTKGQTYFEDWKLPDHSLYKPIETIIHERARGGDGVPRMDTMEYADQVVTDIISRSGDGRFWCGTNAEKTKPASSAPQSLIVSYPSKSLIYLLLDADAFNKGHLHGYGLWIG
jgi:1-acylglycerone phosphate reductase